MDVQLLPWRDGRSNLCARWKGGGHMVMSGHMDTVPAPADGWSADPFGGAVRNGRLLGRGASDMKGGLAAMVSAAVEAALADSPPFTLVVTSAEETGCQGATALRTLRALPEDPILIVGEATGNRVLFGHKGVVWLSVRASGRAAHASRPELGTNAILGLARAVVALEDLRSSAHPRLGRSTVSVGTIHGGAQTNLVPDHAHMDVDVRTVTNRDAAAVIATIEQVTGPGTATTTLDLPAIWTDPASSLSARVQGIVHDMTGQASRPMAAAYFTDAAVLANRVAPRVYVVGPGALDSPHTTNEDCSVEAIRTAQRIYRELLTRLAS
ncbi:MAG: M20 family metallopeptidase [Bifidobacteriaceae bacterium]|nr:M20 family metallopeptidase [Bifidobacteriaceae bacterium]